MVLVSNCYSVSFMIYVTDYSYYQVSVSTEGTYKLLIVYVSHCAKVNFDNFHNVYILHDLSKFPTLPIQLWNKSLLVNYLNYTSSNICAICKPHSCHVCKCVLAAS